MVVVFVCWCGWLWEVRGSALLSHMLSPLLELAMIVQVASFLGVVLCRKRNHLCLCVDGIGTRHESACECPVWSDGISGCA